MGAGDALARDFDALRTGATTSRAERRWLDTIASATLRAESAAFSDPGVVDAVAASYFGDASRPGAHLVGFDPGPRSTASTGRAPVAARRPIDGARFDVVIVGSGPGGSTVAAMVAEAGGRAVVIERGAAAPAGGDHLRNHRAAVHGVDTAPPAGTRRRLDGTAIDDPADPDWHRGAMVVGGGSRVYGAVAWPWLDDDFAMASRYGVPDGSSLADWPFGREELLSHYRWVIDRWGVAGDLARFDRFPGFVSGAGNTFMPPVPAGPGTERLGQGAASIGLHTGPVPMFVNTEERGGRGACVACGECAGFSCPTDARGGAHNTVLADAVATGNAALWADVQVTRITLDPAGRVDGVRWFHHPTRRHGWTGAGHVVVAAGAIETARLLLASADDAHRGHEHGLGNATDQVGRHLQGHGFVSAFGTFDPDGPPMTDDHGPGPTIATLDTAHPAGRIAGADDVVGGGVLGDELVKQPIVHWRWSYPPEAPRHGAGAVETFRRTFRHTGHLFGHVQETPRADNRVRIRARERDRAGVPVADLSGHAHPETVRAGAWVEAQAAAWMAAAGAERTWTEPVGTGLFAGTHQAGTARMGDDPATSVVDPTGRVHGHANLWVADASVHVTNGSVPPTMTIAALAHRLAGHLLGATV